MLPPEYVAESVKWHGPSTAYDPVHMGSGASD